MLIRLFGDKPMLATGHFESALAAQYGMPKLVAALKKQRPCLPNTIQGPRR